MDHLTHLSFIKTITTAFNFDYDKQETKVIFNQCGSFKFVFLTIVFIDAQRGSELDKF